MLSEEHKAWAEDIMRQARGMMARDGFVTPAYFVFTPDEGTFVVPPPDLNVDADKQKVMTAKILQKLCKEKKATLLMYVDEIWMATKKMDAESLDEALEVMDELEMPRPSEDPDRKEALMVIASTPNGDLSMLLAHMYRDAANVPTTAEPEWQDDGGQSKSRMLLPWGEYDA